VAALTSDQIALAFKDGECGRTALFSLKNTTAADTVELATWFKVVKRAGIVSDTGTTIASCTIAGTVVTVPTGPSADGVWLLAVGVSV
jgi:hypothetical protein